MNQSHQSQYPEIVMDNHNNSVNHNMTYPLTIEEYYDLLHHTHKLEDIIIEWGTGGSGSISDAVVNALNIKIDNLSKQVTDQQQTITSMQNTIKQQDQTIQKLQSDLQDCIDNMITTAP